VVGDEVLGIVVVAPGAQADDRNVCLVISSELLEAGGFPGALGSIG
jgi:hypothetical protein